MTGWIMAIGFLVLGVAGLAAGVLLRKKLSRVWMASFCVAGVLLAVLGGALGVASGTRPGRNAPGVTWPCATGAGPRPNRRPSIC